MVSYYDILEIPENASEEDIKRAYRKLALKYHPDKAGPGSETKFKEINTAYEVLSDPERKAIYDKYGEAGLSAVDNPVANSAISALGAAMVGMLVFLLLLLCVVMLLIFLAFLASYVDGRLPSWNFVKVFAPLYVLDIFVGAVSLLVLPVVCCALQRVDLSCFFLCCLSLVLLSMLIPICKDRNEQRTAQGRTDFLKWRVWLIPGYLFSFFLLIGVTASTLPIQRRRWKAKAFGLYHLAAYLPIGFVFSMVEVACVVVFFALVACRADELITVDWFICAGLPCFVCGGLFLVDTFLRSLLGNIVYRPTSDADESGDTHNACSHLDPNNTDESNPYTSVTPNTTTSPGPANADAANDDDDGGGEPSVAGRGGRRQENRGRAAHNEGARRNKDGSSGPQSCTCHAKGRIIRETILLTLLVGLILATVAMVCVRANHYHRYGTYDGVLSLGKALAPLYIVVGVMVVLFLMLLLMLMCGIAMYDIMENKDGTEMSSQGRPPEAETPQPANGVSGGDDPSRVVDDNDDAAHEAVVIPPREETPSSHYPNHEAHSSSSPPPPPPQAENVSDID